ncbi:MAG: T9SS type A sorting domain-containing protein, partial [candidate division Zixibacteria bacterium]|nr:T9SS type A sorting domain-containing protein [candidate division Zixibacteria bacterium]
VVSVQVADTVNPGSILALDFDISGNGGAYTTTLELSFVVPPRPERSFVTHAGGSARFTISNYGALGLGSASFWPAGGEGFRLNAGTNYLYECGLMIGISPLHVSDGVRNAIGEPDGDFGVIPGGNLTMVSPGSLAKEESACRFSDTRSESPMNLEITQRGFTFDTYANNDFVILQYIVKNLNPTSINNLYVGMYFDWDIVSYYSNAGGYDAGRDVAWTAYNSGTTKSDYRGARVLDGPLASVWTQTDSAIVYYSPSYPADGFTEAEKYAALAAGLGTATKFNDTLRDLNQTISAGPLSLAAGAVDTVAIAVLAGTDLAAFEKAALYAQQAYIFMVTDVEDPGELNLPEEFTLHPNYPNPFNPGTTIAFDLPIASEYTLTVYNALGQKVDEITGRAGPGTVKVIWNGESMASGVYLYKVTAGELSASRKMMLLK